MKAWTVVPIVLAAACLGFAAGRLASARVPSPDAGDAAALRRERDEAVERARRADAALAAERLDRTSGAATQRRPADGATSATNADAGAGAGAAGPASAAATPAAEVAELVAQIDLAFETVDGDRALELLRRLASIVPDGRAAAMDLAVRINDDVTGAGTLRLDQYRFYQSLGDTGARDLMLWSLDHPSPAAFRTMAASSLPWVVPPAQAVELFARALPREKDPVVQGAIVGNLAQMNNAAAERLLVSILSDASKDPGIRAQVATALSTTRNEEVVRVIETISVADPDDRVRVAARAALVARDPPVDGFLVTFVFPDGAAAAGGIAAGDILVSYDGHATRAPQEIKDAIESGSGETASAVVLRAGVETPVQVRRGRLGIQGRPVRKRS